MKRSLLLKKLSAAFLLLLFAFGNTPQKVLHDVFAGHTDVACKKDQKQTQTEITNAGFCCDYHQYVAESPFAGTNISFPQHPQFFQQQHQIFYTEFVSSFINHFFQLRAPPVLV